MSEYPKSVFVIMGYSLIDGVFCAGVFEDREDAELQRMFSPEHRRVIKASLFAPSPPKTGARPQ